MQIVIDIPQELYEDIKKCGLCGYCSDREIVSKAIANGTPLPDNPTNGDMMQAIFPNFKYDIWENCWNIWWNAPYKGEQEECIMIAH